MTSARGRADEALAQLREDAWEAGFAKELDALEHRSPTPKLPPQRPQERTMAEIVAEAERLHKSHALVAAKIRTAR